MEETGMNLRGWIRKNGRLSIFVGLAGMMLGTIGAPPPLAAQPPGGYQQSCRSASVDQFGTLHALCKDRGGNEINTQLERFKDCTTEISNLDGRLNCSKGAPPPNGSYQRSCRDVFTRGTVLHASCKDNGGTWRATELRDFSRCVAEPYNFDGALTCFRGSAPPNGSYTRSCKDIVINSVGLVAQCRRTNGTFIQATLPKFSDCTGIANFDGALICSHKPFGQ